MTLTAFSGSDRFESGQAKIDSSKSLKLTSDKSRASSYSMAGESILMTELDVTLLIAQK
jgi:hypothetical protein